MYIKNYNIQKGFANMVIEKFFTFDIKVCLKGKRSFYGKIEFQLVIIFTLLNSNSYGHWHNKIES